MDREQAREQWGRWAAGVVGDDQRRRDIAVEAALRAQEAGADADAAADAAMEALRTVPLSASGAPGTSTCRFCGSTPALDVTIRGHQGLVIMMRFLQQRGPYCRDCGLATLRRMSNETMVRGWLGFMSFFVTPVILLVNLSTWFRLRGLAAPQPGRPGAPLNAPMDPGRPLLRRPGTVVYGVVVVAVGGFLYQSNLGHGGCVASRDDVAHSVVTAHDSAFASSNDAFTKLDTCSDFACSKAQVAVIAAGYRDFNVRIAGLCFPNGSAARVSALRSADEAVGSAGDAVAAVAAPGPEAATRMQAFIDAVKAAEQANSDLNSDLGIRVRTASN